MSRQSVLEAARAVVQRWRSKPPQFPATILVEAQLLEELEALCRAVDDHPQAPAEDLVDGAAVARVEELERQVHDLVGKLAIERSGGPAVATFEEAWAEQQAGGFDYGPEALEQVRFGWQLATAAAAGTDLHRAVAAFFALWDRSEEYDPPSLTEAAAAMRAAAGLEEPEDG